MLTTSQIIAKYGQPGDAENLTVIHLPFPLRIAWDPKTSVQRIQCHRLIADKLRAVFDDLLAHYGYPKLRELGIDIFGGCFNFRQMRGGKDWSRHSWAIAIDLWPEWNQLKWGKDKAKFAQPEYKPMIDIFYKHGFLSLGREKNYDWMHFEIAA